MIWTREIPAEDHLGAWLGLSVRLNLHLERNHGVSVPSNRADWSTLHALRHEAHEDHSLITVYPCACGFDHDPTGTAEWHEKHKPHHLAVFPDVDQRTIDNLDQAIRRAVTTT